jgi:glycosyltransferase involved in cell wall biosynthesis
MPKIRFTRCEPFRFMRHRPDPRLKTELDGFKPDIIFVPLERRMKYRDLPVVTMLQNMAPISGVRVASGILDKAKYLVKGFETRLAFRSAAAVIAPTEYVKNSLIRTLRLKEDKVFTVHYGSNPLPKSVRPASPLASGGHPDQFILTAGSIEVYRGIEDLIQAMVPLKRLFPGLKLLVAGGVRAGTQRYFQGLKKFAGRLNLAEEIVWLGHLPAEELSWCYRNCLAFAMTSREESFGFVALEALEHGCNCVSTSSSCLPEIFKDAALYYEPGDVAALEKALLAVLKRTPAEQAYFKAIAVGRASEFSWDTAAVKTLEILKKAADISR